MSCLGTPNALSVWFLRVAAIRTFALRYRRAARLRHACPSKTPPRPRPHEALAPGQIPLMRPSASGAPVIRPGSGRPAGCAGFRCRAHKPSALCIAACRGSRTTAATGAVGMSGEQIEIVFHSGLRQSQRTCQLGPVPDLPVVMSDHHPESPRRLRRNAMPCSAPNAVVFN
jgi:hypothetical protein